VDLTYRIRAIAPELRNTSEDRPSEPQSKQKVELQDTRTPLGLRQGKALSVINERLQDDKLSAKVDAKGDMLGHV